MDECDYWNWQIARSGGASHVTEPEAVAELVAALQDSGCRQVFARLCGRKDGRWDGVETEVTCGPIRLDVVLSCREGGSIQVEAKINAPLSEGQREAIVSGSGRIDVLLIPRRRVVAERRELGAQAAAKVTMVAWEDVVRAIGRPYRMPVMTRWAQAQSERVQLKLDEADQRGWCKARFIRESGADTGRYFFAQMGDQPFLMSLQQLADDWNRTLESDG